MDNEQSQQQPGPTPEPNLWQPALWAGICAGVLTGVPVLSRACTLWMSGGGALAVYFFQLQYGFPLKRTSDGARIGLFAGFFGFVVFSVVNLLSSILIARGLHNWVQTMRDGMMQASQDDPRMKEAMAPFMTHQGMVLFLILGSLMFLVLFALFSMAGGALGVRASQRRDNPPPV